MTTGPLYFQWTEAGTFKPLPRHVAACDERFCIGERYLIDPIEERSERSHRHYFCCVKESWLNLGDDQAMQFPTPEALRKHALIMTGHREERKLVASSPAEARKIAAFIKAPGDDYLIVSVNGNIVIEWRAKSQSYRAMGGPTFQKSKTDVLEFLSALIGVTPKDLAAQSATAQSKPAPEKYQPHEYLTETVDTRLRGKG